MIQIQDPYLRRLAEVESGMNPLAKNPNSSAGGLFQFIDSTAQQYGLQDRFNPEQSLNAAAKFTEDNKNYLRKRLGREPTPGELYLAHQQGMGGAAELLANPTAPAADIVGPQAVALNAGGQGVTAQDFANQWIGKFEEGYQAPQPEQPPIQMAAADTGNMTDASPDMIADDIIEIEAPDGTIIEFPAGMADADIEKVMAENYPAPQVAPQPEFDITGADLARTAGRAGRNVVGSLASGVDTALLIPKTLANAAEYGLEKTGFGGSALEKFAEKIRTTPTVRSQALGAIDRATGNSLQPRGAIENIGDFAAEMTVPSLGGSFIASKITGKQQSLLQPLSAKNIDYMDADQIRKESSKAYDRAKKSGGQIKSSTTDRFLDNVQKAVMPQTEAGKILAGDTETTKIMERLNNLRGRALSLDEAQEVDEILGDAIDSFVENGVVKKEGNKILDIQRALRNVIETATPDDIDGTKEGFEALKQGRQLWSKQAKLRDVEKIMTRARLSQQPANALKAGFRELLLNAKKTRGYNKEEIKALEKAATSGVVSELLTGPASRLFGIGMAVKGGPLGYAAGKGIEMGSRSLATKDQLSRAQALERLISAGENIPNRAIVSRMNPGQLSALAGIGALGTQKLQER